MSFGLKSINAGALDRRVKLMKQVLTINEMHEEEETYEELTTVWAAVKHIRGYEEFETAQVQAIRSTIFTIRFRDDLTEADQVEHDDGKRYRITLMRELGRRELLELTTEFIQGAA